MDKNVAFQSFAGQFLIATQTDNNSLFGRCVVLITKHSKTNGAEGYIINKPLVSMSPAEVFKDRPFQFLGEDFHIYSGGPVDLDHGAVLHSTDYHALDTHQVLPDLALTETQQILDDISTQQSGPKHFIVMVGKSAWAPNQLEDEIMGNIWIPAPFSFDLMFHTPDNKKWQEALATLKIDANLLAQNAGKA
ncbi:MAG: YqgE/AlgH family protein [Alphaproteobacteria bacterium]|nr:YqgE/AlgH family protein [Alphaproteobacteria bacterium]